MTPFTNSGFFWKVYRHTFGTFEMPSYFSIIYILHGLVHRRKASEPQVAGPNPSIGYIDFTFYTGNFTKNKPLSTKFQALLLFSIKANEKTGSGLKSRISYAFYHFKPEVWNFSPETKQKNVPRLFTFSPFFCPNLFCNGCIGTRHF